LPSMCEALSLIPITSSSKTQNSSKLFCIHWQSDFKVYVERQKTQDSKHDIEEEQRWLTETTQLETHYKATIIKRVWY
jgi:hypothetical protein